MCSSDLLATLDVRWLPDENAEAFVAALRKLVDDPLVEITLSEPGSRKPTPPSRLDTAMFRALEKAQKRVYPNAATLPLMLTGATDSAQLRERGVEAYGVGAEFSDEDSARVHGNDERASISGLRRYLEFLWEAAAETAAAQ